MNTAFVKQWKFPVFSSLLENRLESAIIAGAGALHLGFSLAGFPLWSCPIRLATGIPCPGCGLTRATHQLLHGDFAASLQTHAFAPLFVSALALLLAVLILPKPIRVSIIATIRTVEQQSGLTAILLVLLMVYWTSRILGIIPFPNQF